MCASIGMHLQPVSLGCWRSCSSALCIDQELAWSAGKTGWSRTRVSLLVCQDQPELLVL
jgi:hypothetical protein